jgi:hypothetical protein
MKRRSPAAIARMAILLVSSVLATFTQGCAGYQFQRSGNELLEKEGIRSIYISPLMNDSYKPGVENLVYNELVRTVLAGRRVKLAGRPEEADAILVGRVTTASYSPAGAVPSQNIFPHSEDELVKKKPIPLEGPENILVATEYGATLSCNFSLERQVVQKGKPRNLWSSSFSRSRPFPGNNQRGVFGTTSPLINESEFDRILRDMAQSMMADLHESMLAMF